MRKSHRVGRRPTQKAIARQVGVDVSTVNKVLRQRKDAHFSHHTIQAVLRTAQELGYDTERVKHTHVRSAPRKKVSIRAEFSIHRSTGHVVERASATIRDISVCGALLEDVRVPSGRLPVGPFWIVLRPLEGTARGLEIPARIVRLGTGEIVAYGIAFFELGPAILKALQGVR